MKRRVIIIGGGASGLAAAVSAARAGAETVILEHKDRVGKKLLSTGNGRCNLANEKLDASCYRCSQPEFPMKVLNHFGLAETLAFFRSLGIETKSRNGYLYPLSDQASAVLDLLRFSAAHLGVEIRTDCQVKEILPGRRFRVQTSLGNVEGDALILAAGSRAAPSTGSDGSGYELAKSLGHKVLRPLPALVQLRCKGSIFRQTAGVRCDARVSLVSGGRILAEDAGEVQLTDYGISGIPVFQVSRYASVALAEGKTVQAVLNLLPSLDDAEAERFLAERARRLGYLPWTDFLTGVLNKKLAQAMVREAGLTGRAGDPSGLARLLALLRHWEVPVTATNSFDQAQVCCGGADTRQVRPENLASRLVPGLYLTGELLDVDGICGGYNLQWAWATGCLAGRDAAGIRREDHDTDRAAETSGRSRPGGAFKKDRPAS